MKENDNILKGNKKRTKEINLGEYNRYPFIYTYVYHSLCRFNRQLLAASIMGSLKTFIKAVRNSKTIAAERAVIRKESAKIRSSFRDPHLDNEKRRKNIQKLLYLYILGEPTQFGQVECLKLIASTKFSDKRIGYMVAMLIMDESQDILTLLTNSLDIDMKNANPLIIGLALTALGNLTSPELAKDLYPNVEKLLNSSQSYIKKKAALVASKLVEKDPVLCEVYLPYLDNLLNEKSHGVLLGTLVLINTIYFNDNSCHKQLVQYIPKILSHIKLLQSSSYSPEYDVKGIPDPFLFVSLLKTVRILLSSSNIYSNDDMKYNSDYLLESVNDVLTQVCAKFENTKGSGYSILYEAVKTIFTIQSDSSLKVLGVNILSKFLIQKDNNIRYVALDTLLQVIEYEPLAVQRHRNTIVGCLHDGDISIRRRALELTFGITNQQNIKLLFKEILKYLKVEQDEDLKHYITSQMTILCENYNSNVEWTLNTMISMLNIAGNYCNDNILSTILSIIMQSSGNQELIKETLVRLVKTFNSGLYDQYGLSLVTVWCLGEYSDLIIDNNNAEMNESKIFDIINSILAVSDFSNDDEKLKIKIYVLTACLKLSVKFKIPSNVEKLRMIISNASKDINLEIQTRAVEYLKIFGEPMTIKRGLLERMPAPPVKKQEITSLLNRTTLYGENAVKDTNQGSSKASKSGDLLLDLLGDDDTSKKTNSNSTLSKGINGKEKDNVIDLLSDIFGTSSINATTSNNNGNTIDSKEPESLEVFNDGSIRVGFIVEKVASGSCELQAVVKNISTNTITGISVLCAVSKQQNLQLSSIAKTTLNAQDYTPLTLKITGKPGSKVKVRVKLGYILNGKVDRQFDYVNSENTL